MSNIENTTMSKFERYTLIFLGVFVYFFVLGFITWDLRIGLIGLTLLGFFYTKYMVKFIQKYHKETDK